jgi:anoctamin-10
MQTAFYFAFTQTYILFLFFPAITGLLAWAFQPQYSLLYTILTGLWCTVFVEYWKLKEIDLSIRWAVKGIGSLKTDRPQFIYEKVIVDDAGRTKHYYPRWKQIARRLVQIPFVLAAALSLGALIVVVVAIEVLISEAYDGPHKRYLVCAESLPSPGYLLLHVREAHGLCRNTSQPRFWPSPCHTSASFWRTSLRP